ncbi:MAG: ATP-binding protein [Oligoflexia bacterium]|nr:ATP-binding protein [Oligoflexia bacterium]
MYINRLIKKDIQKRLSLKKTKIIVLYGARQVGKTSLMEDILKQTTQKVLKLNGDEDKTARLFSSRDLKKMKGAVSGYDVLFIDEAQKIQDIGLNLKILYDDKTQLKIIVTGSSSFELASSIHEPLTGRAWTYHLHPIAMCELKKHWNFHELTEQLESYLIFGTYPELFSMEQISDRQEYLHSLSKDYLYKDVLEVEGVRSSQKIRKLLQLLAFQTGSEVSLTELAGRLEMHKKTVERYIDLLEKFFVIFTLTGFSRNLRKEISQKPKVYFYDLGIRNALINNFNSLEDRNDIGMLWENFIIAEKLKYNNYYKNFVSSYFWRTYTGAELDYIEEYKGKLSGYEIKWKKTSKAPLSWLESYKADFNCINKNNFLEFICPD